MSTAYSRNNPDKIRANNRRWYESNRAYAIAKAAEWKRNNPESFSISTRKNEAKRRAAEGSFAHRDVMRMFSAQDGKCAACGCDIAAAYEIDHIIPISRGGSNWPMNLQLLCTVCNRSKAAKMPIAWLMMRFSTVQDVAAGLTLQKVEGEQPDATA